MPEQQGEQSRSIKEIGTLVKSLVEPETAGYPFWTRGYVQNFRPSDRGHLYFELREEDYFIHCSLREQFRQTLDFVLANDMQIEVFGEVRIYEYQTRAEIEVEKVRLLQRKPFILDNASRMELEEKGIWPKTKRALPAKINRIGVITSQYSEARYDFETNYKKEGGRAELEFTNIRLQGKDAAQEISGAITKHHNLSDVDVIVLTRGGGSQADLAVFNDIRIAEAICRSSIPVITGIGHQRNETFADHVADLQESTPTAVAFRLARVSNPPVRAVSNLRWIAAYVLAGIAILVILGLVIALFARN